MEAMALGLPCVSTDCSGGGARTIISDGVDGLIVPCGDKDAIVEKVLGIIEDKEFAHQLSANAYEKGKCFTTKKVVDLWEQYLKSIVSK